MKLNFVYSFIISLLFCSCSGIRQVQVLGIKNFQSINTLTEPEFQFDVRIKNPNTFSMKIINCEIGFYNGTTDLISSKMKRKYKIGKSQTVDIPVQMKPSINAINLLLKTEMNNLVRGKVTSQLELRGRLTIRKFIFSKKINIKEPVKF